MLISNVTWTLNYEVFFYMALPLFGAVFLYRKHWIQVVACLIGIYTLYQVIGWEHSLKKHILMSFLGGIAAAYWVRNPERMAWGQTPKAGWIALLALAIELLLFRKSFAIFPLMLLTVFFYDCGLGQHTLRCTETAQYPLDGRNQLQHLLAAWLRHLAVDATLATGAAIRHQGALGFPDSHSLQQLLVDSSQQLDVFVD
jgi:hypothetical protein